MMRGAAILLAALALIGLSAASGLDRMAAGDPALAARIPAPLANTALRTLGGVALDSDRAGDAAAYGWHAIDRAPTDAESVALFAAGTLAAGDGPLAQRAFLLAGRMGWRVPLTQAYWLDQSLRSGDYDQAALRLDALLRQLPTLVGQQALLDPVERNPEARAAFVERITPDTEWLGRYLNEVYMLPPEGLRQRGWVVIDAARAGRGLSCAASVELVSAMVNKALYAEAEQVWAVQCPDSTGPLMGGEDFAGLNLQGTRNPFAWQAIGSGDVLLGLAPQAGQNGQRLTIDGTPATMQRFLSKLLLLKPGRYVVTWRAGGGEGSPAGGRIRASLACSNASEQWQDPRYDPATKRWYISAAVPTGCPAQRLTFALASGGGSLWLEAVNLYPQP